MAQYGDPHHEDLSRFQRYRPGSEPSPPGQPLNGNGVYRPSASGRNSQPSPNAYSQGAQPSAPGSGGLSPRPEEGTEPWSQGDSSSWSQSLSVTARKRNQWRQFQSLKPDFGTPSPPVEPTVAPPRPASLPNFPDASRQVRPQTGTSQSGWGQRPAQRLNQAQPLASGPSGETGSYFSQASESVARRSHTSNAPQGQPPMGALSAQSPVFPRARSRFRQDQRTLQPHPHSTTLTDAGVAPRGAAPAQRPVAGASAKVTPLRPGHAKPQRHVSSNNTAQSDGSTRNRESSSGGTRTRQPAGAIAKPRRRFAKAPLPLLYLIRLLILGVGVAAIAGTLLSVLSPSNVATTSDPEQTVGDVAAPLAYGSLVTGTTATMVSDIALAEDLTRLAAEIEQLASLTPGMTQSVFIVDLDSGDYVDIAGTQAFAAASTIKVPILVAFLQQVDAGNIALNQGLVMTEGQMAGGSGTMQNDPVGTRYTALEVASRMITTSDNTATNMIVDALGGIEALNQRFQAWGLESTVLRNPLPDLDGTNTTSTRDLGLLMALVDQGGLLTPRSRDRLMGIMQRTVNRSLIPYGISDDSLLANKTGDIESLLGDVALVDVPNGKRYVIATLIERPENDGRASELIRRTAETAHTELSQPIAPVGGIDPSSPETGVPDPEGYDPVEPATVPPPETESPDRETIPQG